VEVEQEELAAVGEDPVLAAVAFPEERVLEDRAQEVRGDRAEARAAEAV